MDTEAAYVAGMVDADGSVIASPRRGTTRLQIRVIVVNVDEALMDWLVAHIGGNKNRRTIPSNFTSTPQPIWTWTVNGMNAVALLRQIERFMIVKRAKAVAAIESQPRKP